MKVYDRVEVTRSWFGLVVMLNRDVRTAPVIYRAYLPADEESAGKPLLQKCTQKNVTFQRLQKQFVLGVRNNSRTMYRHGGYKSELKLADTMNEGDFLKRCPVNRHTCHGWCGTESHASASRGQRRHPGPILRTMHWELLAHTGF